MGQTQTCIICNSSCVAYILYEINNISVLHICLGIWSNQPQSNIHKGPDPEYVLECPERPWLFMEVTQSPCPKPRPALCHRALSSVTNHARLWSVHDNSNWFRHQSHVTWVYISFRTHISTRLNWSHFSLMGLSPLLYKIYLFLFLFWISWLLT